MTTPPYQPPYQWQPPPPPHPEANKAMAGDVEAAKKCWDWMASEMKTLAPLLGNDRRRIELMNALLFSLPGTPVLYYGDEIGMGENIYLGDRNGVRTPMQWSSDKNAGFS